MCSLLTAVCVHLDGLNAEDQFRVWVTILDNTSHISQRTIERYGAFKSCRIHRIYELNAHERHHKVVVTSGKLEIFFKPRVSELGACQ